MGSGLELNNLRLFRELSGLQRQEITFFLHTSIHVYHYYEIDKVTIPEEIKVLLSKLYDVPMDELFISEGKVSNSTKEKLQRIACLDEEQRMKYLSRNLSGGKYDKLKFDQIEQIKHGKQ